MTWSVNGVAGGDGTSGTISSKGSYTAPASLPATNPVAITATSVQDPTKSGNTTLSIFTLSVSPTSATVFYNHTQQFTAAVTGISTPSLIWQAARGSVDATGLYTPPSLLVQNATDTISVNLQNAGGSPVAAAITLQIPPPVLTSIGPSSASAYETVAIDGQDLLGVQSVVFPGPFGMSLLADFQASSTSQVSATVPLGAISGPVYLTLQPLQGLTTTSNSIAFVRLPNLRIRTSQKDLSSGEVTQFTYTLLGGTSPTAVTWTADFGNISASGSYQAPTVAQEQFATITACLQNTRSCDSTMLRIVPLRITPPTPVVSIGQSVQLAAVEGSPTSANWSVLAGGGAISSTGLFAASTNPAQAGRILVSASAGSVTTTGSVAVTGGFPGLLKRTYDYMNRGYDPTTQRFLQDMEGTFVRDVAVSGNRAYALDLGVRANPFPSSPPFAAVETYDISNPLTPVWLGAAESISDRVSDFSIYSHYLFEVDTGTMVGSRFNPPSRIALYDIQTVPAHLLSFVTTPDLYSVNENNGILYGAPLNSYIGATVPAYEFDITGGTVQQQQVNLLPPAGALAGAPPFSVIGNGSLIYAAFNMQAGGGEVTAYDASVSPANLLGTAVVSSGLTSVKMLIRGNLLFLGNLIFDIGNRVPVQVGTAPTQAIEDIAGTQVLGRGFLPIYTQPDNEVLIDISNPAVPVIEASAYDFPDAVNVSGKFVGLGNLVLTNQGFGGLATTDLSIRGGLIDKARVPVFPDGYIFDHAIKQQTMYVAGATALGSGGLITFDLSSGMPTQSGALLYAQNEGLAMQVSNTDVFLGLLDTLKTIDVSNPANPIETGSLALPTNALALSGSILYDGTGDGRVVSLNVSNANAPSLLGSTNLPVPAVALRVSGNQLFVADGSAGLIVLDVSNPAAPVWVGQISFPTPVWDVAVSGPLAFLAVDSTGFVVVDVSNASQPKQVSQTTLESWNPFPVFLDAGPQSVATAVAVQNGIVYVGTANSLGLVFGFDCSQPNYPRLVSMNAFGEFVDSLVSGFAFAGTDIYVFGSLGVNDDIVQADNSAPRNAIGLYYPPLALRSVDFTMSARLGLRGPSLFSHPKLDHKVLRRRHAYTIRQH